MHKGNSNIFFHPEGYRQCTISVMDTIADPDISFDRNGVSNYYYEYKKAEEIFVLKGEAGEKKIREIIAEIKWVQKNQRYDCILGVSGGVDSTYLAYLLPKNSHLHNIVFQIPTY